MIDCIHGTDLRQWCDDCAEELTHPADLMRGGQGNAHARIVDGPLLAAKVAELERNQTPSSFHEALNSGDGSYRP